MALTITIAAVDKTSVIERSSIRVTQVLTKVSDQLSFNINLYGTKTYRPNVGDEVIFTNGSTRIFAGNILKITGLTDGLAQVLQVIVVDYSAKLNSQLVSKSYTSMTAAAIITDLLTNFSDGTFTTANVVAPTVIASVVFNYISISDCLKKLVSILSGYDWYVDYSKDIHFAPIGTALAPFNLTDTSANYLYNSLQIESDISQIANDIIVRGGKVVGSSTRTEYWSGDTTRTNFPLANDFNAAPTVTVGGVAKTVGIDGVDADASFQFMWNQGSQLIRSTSGNTPGSGTNNIVIVGTPRFQLIYRKQNQASVTTYGAKQKILTDSTIIDVTTASKRADAELAAYALPTGSAQFATYTDGLAVGQYITITSTLRNTTQGYKIQQITTSCRTPSALLYQVQLQTAATLNMDDVLNLLLIQNPANAAATDPNTVVQRVSLFSESMTMTETVHAPTQTSPPYKYDTAKFGLATWS